MSKQILLLLILTMTALGAEDGGTGRRRLWKWSLGVLVAANAADAITSMGRHELNPVLGTGQFGPRAAGVKIGISAVAMGAQCLILRRRPEAMRTAAYVNFAMAGATGGVAAINSGH